MKKHIFIILLKATHISADGSNWVNLDLADSFTENDVEMNRIRYQHASVLGSKGKAS